MTEYKPGQKVTTPRYEPGPRRLERMTGVVREINSVVEETGEPYYIVDLPEAMTSADGRTYGAVGRAHSELEPFSDGV